MLTSNSEPVCKMMKFAKVRFSSFVISYDGIGTYFCVKLPNNKQLINKKKSATKDFAL